ncbi:hypothetical protein DFH28DRAFT_934396 [Melampsora americana]|nr:hypothetical protein DFH28DRAFT_934396 [Melampsora americana]
MYGKNGTNSANQMWPSGLGPVRYPSTLQVYTCEVYTCGSAGRPGLPRGWYFGRSPRKSMGLARSTSRFDQNIKTSRLKNLAGQPQGVHLKVQPRSLYQTANFQVYTSKCIPRILAESTSRLMATERALNKCQAHFTKFQKCVRPLLVAENPWLNGSRDSVSISDSD